MSITGNRFTVSIAMMVIASLASSRSIPADSPEWAVGVISAGGFGGGEWGGVYVDSDLRLGVMESEWPLKASICVSTFLDQVDAAAIETLLLEMQAAIPNRAFWQVQSDCKDDVTVRVDVEGPQGQSRRFDYPSSKSCLGDGTVPTWLVSLVERVRAHSAEVEACARLEND